MLSKLANNLIQGPRATMLQKWVGDEDSRMKEGMVLGARRCAGLPYTVLQAYQAYPTSARHPDPGSMASSAACAAELAAAVLKGLASR